MPDLTVFEHYLSCCPCIFQDALSIVRLILSVYMPSGDCSPGFMSPEGIYTDIYPNIYPNICTDIYTGKTRENIK